MLLTVMSPRFLFLLPMKIKMLEVRHAAVKNPVKYCLIWSPLWIKSSANLANDLKTKKLATSMWH